MYSIGRFASIGRVTVRMLRHWDEIGLLNPAHVNPTTGYRSYAPEQLAELDGIVRLRDLGVGLADIGRIIRPTVGAPAARQVLEAAREELRRTVTAESDRLARFDAYLREPEGVTTMSDPATDLVFQAVAAQRVATITRSAAGYGSRNIGPVVGPMFPEVEALLAAHGIAHAAAVAIYESDESGDGSTVLVTAGFEVGADVAAVSGLDVHDLPALERAVIATHHGSMQTIDRSWHALMETVRAGGSVSSDAPREIYLTPGDRPQSEWVTRLVQPVTTVCP